MSVEKFGWAIQKSLFAQTNQDSTFSHTRKNSKMFNITSRAYGQGFSYMLFLFVLQFHARGNIFQCFFIFFQFTFFFLPYFFVCLFVLDKITLVFVPEISRYYFIDCKTTKYISFNAERKNNYDFYTGGRKTSNLTYQILNNSSRLNY